MRTETPAGHTPNGRHIAPMAFTLVAVALELQIREGSVPIADAAEKNRPRCIMAATEMASWINPQLRDPTSRFRLVNTRTGAAIADVVAGAFDPAARRRGLLGRDALGASEALIIAPTNAIHTFFMRFDIDVAFVARDGRIVKIRARIPPWRIAAALGAFAVVEVAAGVFGATGTKTGDTLALLCP